jgi:hypothetical protein
VRLYADLSFQTYMEVPRDAIVLAEATDRQNENSPSRLHVRASAQLNAVLSSTQTAASFLEGSITSAYLAAATGASAAAAPKPHPTEVCTIGHCQTGFGHCPSNVIPCPITHPGQCNPTAVPHCAAFAGAGGGAGAHVAFATQPPVLCAATLPVICTPCALHTIHVVSQPPVHCPPCANFTLVLHTQNLIQCTTFCTQPAVCRTTVFIPCPPLTITVPIPDPTGVGG